MTSEREEQNEQTEHIPTSLRRECWDRLWRLLLAPIDDTVLEEQPRQTGGDEEVADPSDDSTA